MFVEHNLILLLNKKKFSCDFDSQKLLNIENYRFKRFFCSSVAIFA